MNHRILRRNQLAFAFFALLPGLFSCSSAPEPPTVETVQVMPENYPTKAADTLKKLAGDIPSAPDALFFTSYGSIVDTIKEAKTYHLVDEKEINSVLNDLGTHYKLNPSLLKSWFKAGFHTGSGFVAGWQEQNPFVVADVFDIAAFRAWFDTFLNEEFGRPKYQEEEYGGKTYIQIQIMNRDFATLIVAPNHAAVLVFGEGLADGAASTPELSRNLSFGIPDNSVNDISGLLKGSPMALWFKSSEGLITQFPKPIRQAAEWTETAGAELSLRQTGPSVRVIGSWKRDLFQDTPRGKFISALTKGSNGSWSERMHSTNPTSVMRLLFDPEVLESFVLPYISEKHRAKYADAKDKLTQRLLHLNVSDQIIYNIASVWAAFYGSAAPEAENPSLMDIMAVQNAALFVPFKDINKSNAFFSKINILKKFIPEEKAKVVMEDGILHATIMLDGQQIHAGYCEGLLAITTDSAWEKLNTMMKIEREPGSSAAWANETQFAAADIKVSDLITVLSSHNKSFSKKYGKTLGLLDQIKVRSSTNETTFDVSIEGQLKK